MENSGHSRDHLHYRLCGIRLTKFLWCFVISYMNQIDKPKFHPSLNLMDHGWEDLRITEVLIARRKPIVNEFFFIFATLAIKCHN